MISLTQGSRLTFQLGSPVASDRFDPVAKTNFSLARHLNIHCRIKSNIMQYGPLILKKSPSKPQNWCRRKTFFSFKLPIHDFHVQTNLLGQLGLVPFDLKFRFESFHQARPISFYSRLSPFPTKNYSTKC